MEDKRFIKELHEEIRGSITLKKPTTFATTLGIALILDNNITKKEQPHLENGSTSGILRRFLSTSTTQPCKAHNSNFKGKFLFLCAPLAKGKGVLLGNARREGMFVLDVTKRATSLGNVQPWLACFYPVGGDFL